MTAPAKVTKRRIRAALDTLADLTTEEHEELDGQTRDEIGRVRNALWLILESKR